MLGKYTKLFSKLNTDKNRKRWTELTHYQAPHKPLLLISVMDLIAQGSITENFIEPSYELVDTFNNYWSSIMPIGKTTSMAYPFFYMRSEGFWHLVPDKNEQVSSVSKLREIYNGSILDDELYRLLCDPETREQLRVVLVNSYFAEEIRPVLIEQGNINLEAYKYSQELLKAAEKEKSYGNDNDEDKKVRDQGFRKAIVMLYEHRCAMCGIRMLTPEGHTIVEAAHIVSWSESHNDSPTNGMALCKLCHWSFDEGLMSVGDNYEVLVSKRVNTENNFPGHIMTLSDRSIFKPDKEKYWPEQENLDWHRGNVFFN